MRFLCLAAAAWGLPAAGPTVTQAVARGGPAGHPRPLPPLLSPAGSRVFCVREAEGVGDAVKTRGTAGAWQEPPLCLSQPPDCTRLGSALCRFGSPVPTLGFASPERGRERRVARAALVHAPFVLFLCFSWLSRSLFGRRMLRQFNI